MIYLDSAATSVLKPDSVKNAVIKAMSGMSSPGRGTHSFAMKAAETVYECRERIARLCNVDSAEKIVFTFNATHSLNIAINSLVERGTRVLTSGYEHNSVMRPLRAAGAELVVVDTPLFEPEMFLERAEKMLRGCDIVVCTHVSNVFGYVLPVYELAGLCRHYGKPLVIDASQSAGSIELDAERLGADFIAFPGHKGLMGPQGTGVLICKNEAKPLLYGGSGSNSILTTMPDFLPDRLEAGTHNTAGIAGLSEGVRYVLSKGIEKIRRHERKLLDEFVSPLLGERALKVFYSEDINRQSGLVSVQPLKTSCELLAEKLAEAGIAARAGLHCAPSAHASAGTLDCGTLRFSFSPFISSAQAHTASHEFKKILKKA